MYKKKLELFFIDHIKLISYLLNQKELKYGFIKDENFDFYYSGKNNNIEIFTTTKYNINIINNILKKIAKDLKMEVSLDWKFSNNYIINLNNNNNYLFFKRIYNYCDGIINNNDKLKILVEKKLLQFNDCKIINVKDIKNKSKYNLIIKYSDNIDQKLLLNIKKHLKKYKIQYKTINNNFIFNRFKNKNIDFLTIQINKDFYLKNKDFFELKKDFNSLFYHIFYK